MIYIHVLPKYGKHNTPMAMSRKIFFLKAIKLLAELTHVPHQLKVILSRYSGLAVLNIH